MPVVPEELVDSDVPVVSDVLCEPDVVAPIDTPSE